MAQETPEEQTEAEGEAIDVEQTDDAVMEAAAAVGSDNEADLAGREGARIGNARRVENFTWPGFVDALATLLMVIIFVLFRGRAVPQCSCIF